MEMGILWRHDGFDAGRCRGAATAWKEGQPPPSRTGI
jgi:hypothetical protein